jgi:DNA topoisomerase-1
MNRIMEKTEKRKNVLARTVEILKPALDKINRQENVIGEKLTDAIRKTKIEERIIGICPACKTGRLIIIRSRKTSKRFIGCTNYFKGLCRTSFPLPQSGAVRILGRNCFKCGWPMIHVRVGRKRPWNLCFNPKCQSKLNRVQS